MCSFIGDPRRALGSKHGSYDWLQEFTKPNQANGPSRFTPDGFSKSLMKFNEAPDELIQRLEQYNSDIRIRDLSEEMVRYACRRNYTAKAWIFLMDKVAKLLEDSKVSTVASPPTLSDRSKELHDALEKAREAEDADTQLTKTKPVSAFLERSIAEDNREEASSK